ncbi:MAG: pirin family protein [Bdellovibrionales bacterium]|jgi:redox-sensitive bicupin YhaK (pirin superfamily)|nr:pirin family protein [Bdellovibrionales bacterium]
MKKVLFTQRSDTPHWVGDGFPVRSIFSYNDLAREISPFLLMDYAGPTEFPPSPRHTRGVGEHPHRGFETVTIVYAGEVEHRDSAGGGGLIKAGDVQWMTAASGVVHEEMHGAEFARKGGLFEMVQLWVNLPKKDKMSAPRYQGIASDEIRKVEIEGGTVRVIAGAFQRDGVEHRGPAMTYTPINLWDLRLKTGSRNVIRVPSDHTAAVFVLEGQVTIGEGAQERKIGPAELALLEREGNRFVITADEDSKVLFLGGEPIQEPVVGYGPFVMNSYPEIRQAFVDFEQGRMGRLPKPTAKDLREAE